METGYPAMDLNMDLNLEKPLVFGPCSPAQESTVLKREWEKLSKPVQESICQEAHRLVNGERDQQYVSVRSNFERIAKLWEPIFGVPITAEQVGLAMVQLKIARQLNKPKRDNLVDAAGYLLCVEKLAEGKK